jgi:hypothetical protein
VIFDRWFIFLSVRLIFLNLSPAFHGEDFGVPKLKLLVPFFTSILHYQGRPELCPLFNQSLPLPGCIPRSYHDNTSDLVRVRRHPLPSSSHLHSWNTQNSNHYVLCVTGPELEFLDSPLLLGVVCCTSLREPIGLGI